MRRKGTVPDTARMGAALARPGMDPRVWAAIGYIDGDVNVDKDHGPIVKVVLYPDLMPETARVGTLYAGNGFGLYLPVHDGDDVLVVAPDGDPSSGLIVASVLHSNTDKPPDEAVNNPSDLVLKVEKDAKVRVVVTGQGNIVLKVDQGKVLLGDETGTIPINLKGDDVDLGTFLHTPASGAGVTPCQLQWVAPLVPPPAPTTITSGGADLTGKTKGGSAHTEST